MEHSRPIEPGESPRENLPVDPGALLRAHYDAQCRMLRDDFSRHPHDLASGAAAILARSHAVDELIGAAWEQLTFELKVPASGLALVALGGYGRQELFPCSDVDLMFLLEARSNERAARDAIRQLNQMLWDLGLKVSPVTRYLSECERYEPENVEFTLALLDARPVAGDQALARMLTVQAVPKLLGREAPKIALRLLEVTRSRHTRYGDTLFHIEPNIKECPGGLRDVHVCVWIMRLLPGSSISRQLDREFVEAARFLTLVRVFLHLRMGRDDNTLDWQAQDAAAAARLGVPNAATAIDAGYWMRQYFRHARTVERTMDRIMEELEPAPKLRVPVRSPTGQSTGGFEIRQGRIGFSQPITSGGSAVSAAPAVDSATDPEIVLSLFAAMAATGARLMPDAASLLEKALPELSQALEDGPKLWLSLQEILRGPSAGAALRAMHALGLLELILPEFHGIDALVLRDAYHRYTVDEHTFVVIDTLHSLSGLETARTSSRDTSLASWGARFGGLFHDLPHRELLLLGALLHDTGKGRASDQHAVESARMAEGVLGRLELDSYETGLVLELIRNHLEMSSALRRDVFDPETIRSFAARVPNPEVLRMLTLFTYADIAAVHPDALTSWKAENLWRLYNATANWLDRSVDDVRVATDASNVLKDLLMRVQALLPRTPEKVNAYLEGFPQRYLQTRTPDTIRLHIELSAQLSGDLAVELDFRYAPGVSEIALISNDRPRLFATMAGALAAWGMNIITADAFSNAHGIVVDSFRFTDTFRTLELNESERERFLSSVRDVMNGSTDPDLLLKSRRRGRHPVAKTQVGTRIVFDDSASRQSTLLQVIAQDVPGLLRALSLTLAEHLCNIEVALVDTEGETAIDVFYITHAGQKVPAEQQEALRQALLEAIEENARF